MYNKKSGAKVVETVNENIATIEVEGVSHDVSLEEVDRFLAISQLAQARAGELARKNLKLNIIKVGKTIGAGIGFASKKVGTVRHHAFKGVGVVVGTVANAGKTLVDDISEGIKVTQ